MSYSLKTLEAAEVSETFGSHRCLCELSQRVSESLRVNDEEKHRKHSCCSLQGSIQVCRGAFKSSCRLFLPVG